MKIRQLFLLVAMCLLLCSCSQNVTNNDTDSIMQDYYNRSILAREYADETFQRLLNQFASNIEILETAYGFYTSETTIYVVGYKYSNGINDDFTYAYKISVNDNNSCTIIEEGEEIASFLFEE